MSTPVVGLPANPVVETYPYCGACGYTVSTLSPNHNSDQFCDSCGADLSSYWNALTPPPAVVATPSDDEVSFAYTVNSAADSTQTSESDDSLATWSDFATDTSPTVIAVTEAGVIAGVRVRSVKGGQFGPHIEQTSGVPITAVLTGTAIAGGVVESEIVTGGATIIITLDNDEWVALVGDDDAITEALIAGITSDGVEAAGWEAEVKANMVHGDVTRTNANVVTIILDAEADYAITADETVTVTIPAIAVDSAGAVVATPTMPITDETPTAAVTGTAVAGGVLESEIVTGGETIILTLTGATWEATVGDDNAITTALIAGITAVEVEAAGWNAEVRDNMVHGDVVLTDPVTVTITTAAESAYSVTADENVTVTIPDTAIANQAGMVATPNVVVTEGS